MRLMPCCSAAMRRMVLSSRLSRATSPRSKSYCPWCVARSKAFEPDFRRLNLPWCRTAARSFALQTAYQGEYAQIHQQVQSLVAEDVPVHVCETHASWYAVSAEDFPEYVDVAPTGPGQIQLYLDMDYELIVIQPLN